MQSNDKFHGIHALIRADRPHMLGKAYQFYSDGLGRLKTKANHSRGDLFGLMVKPPQISTAWLSERLLSPSPHSEIAGWGPPGHCAPSPLELDLIPSTLDTPPRNWGRVDFRNLSELSHPKTSNLDSRDFTRLDPTTVFDLAPDYGIKWLSFWLKSSGLQPKLQAL